MLSKFWWMISINDLKDNWTYFLYPLWSYRNICKYMLFILDLNLPYSVYYTHCINCPYIQCVEFPVVAYSDCPVWFQLQLQQHKGRTEWKKTEIMFLLRYTDNLHTVNDMSQLYLIQYQLIRRAMCTTGNWVRCFELFSNILVFAREGFISLAKPNK